MRSRTVWPRSTLVQRRFRVDTRRFRLLDSAKIGGSELLADDPGKGVVLEDAEGRKLSAAEVPARGEFEDAGPLRVVLCVRGQFGVEGRRRRITCAGCTSAGKPEVRVFLTVRESVGPPARRQHLGPTRRGSVFLEDLSIVLPLARVSLGKARCRTNHDRASCCGDQALPGFFGRRELAVGQPYRQGLRCAGQLSRLPDRGRAAGCQRESRRRLARCSRKAGRRGGCGSANSGRTSPSAGAIEWRTVRIALWPREFAGVHELQGGEQKTCEMLLSFHGLPTRIWRVSKPGSDHFTNRSTQCPTRPRCLRRGPFGRPRHSTASGILAWRRRATPTWWRPPDATTIQTQWEQIDEFGWRHFGDTFADNEAHRRR